MYCAVVVSVNPREIPITAKKVPGGLPDIRSTITSRPEIAQAEINPASDQ
jgi:hypothetical protein